MKNKPSAVLITGASKRLGFALARHSLSMGFSVVAHYRSGTGTLGSWVARHPSLRKRVFFLQADLETDSHKLFRDALQLPVSLAGLVNNASEFTAGALTDTGHFEHCIRINALAPHILAREFFTRIKSGWIINITDAHVRPLNRTFQNYRISKLLLAELTRQEAFTFAPSVRVNAIAPGPVLPSEQNGAAAFKDIVRKTPLKHAAHIACILKAYTYLIENCCVTGEVLNVDSGWHLVE